MMRRAWVLAAVAAAALGLAGLAVSTAARGQPVSAPMRIAPPVAAPGEMFPNVDPADPDADAAPDDADTIGDADTPESPKKPLELGPAQLLARAGATRETDLVTTRQGSRFVGTVMAVESGGAVRMTGPEFAGEVRLVAGAADRVLFAKGEKEAGDHEVVLAGGDRIRGTIVSITSAGVAVDTSAAGRVTILPSQIAAIRVAKSKDALLETDFTAGDGGPWKTRGAGSYWVLGEGGLEYLAQSDDPGMAPVFAPLPQKEAVTIIAKIRPVGSNEIGVDLVLGSDGSVVAKKQIDVNQDDNYLYGPACIFATFERGEVNLSCMSGGGVNQSFGRNPEHPVTDWTLRLSYDPETSKAHMWIGGEDLGEYILPAKPPNPKYVMFNAHNPVIVESVSVLRGVVPPGSARVRAEAKTVVQFINGDRVSATGLVLADGTMTLVTDHGEIHCALQSVAMIVMAKTAAVTAPAKEPRILVRTAACQLTLVFDRMTADELVGRSEALGEVRLHRAAVREIDFNPDAPKKGSGAPDSASSQPPRSGRGDGILLLR